MSTQKIRFGIVGTGTIDIDGKVGEIGGVKYKLKGAIKNDADIFFVPNGKNYEEAIKLKKKHGYDIKIVGVSTLDDAISYLENL
jgi:PDZ domain-containing protein